MNPKTTLKRASRVFLLMILVCTSFNANATTVNYESPQIPLRVDSIGSLFRLDNTKINQILEYAKQILETVSQQYPEGVQPIDLNFNLKFDLDIKSSDPFLLLQVIYNTLAGDDGMVNQLKDKKIEKFDEK